MTPQSFLFEEEYWCGISSEEVQDGFGVGCVGILGGYRPVNWDEIKSDGTSKVFFELVVKSFTSLECGWLGIIEVFLVLHLLAINWITKQS